MEALSSHSSYLLQQLQEQRIQGLLCDCMLVVKGVCFKAHKNVLAAFSSYFRSLFQNSPSQKNEVFNLVIQDVGGIGQVLDYMYTSHLDVNQDNVQALLDIAQCLQVPNIQNMCNAFLKPCPPPSETTSSFSLPGGALTSEHESCLLDSGGGGLPHDMSDLHCPSSSEAPRPSFNADLDHAKKLSASVAHSGANCDIVDKQLAHSYKLRNFYSKQYFKQSAVETSNALASNQGPSPLVMVDEQQYQAHNSHPTACTGSTGQPNTPSYTSTPVEKTTSGPSLPPPAPEETLTTPNNSADPADPSLSRLSPVRPKKTVYLKKYNYLRSQKTLEEMCAEPIVEPVLASGPKECPQPYPREQTSAVQHELPEAPADDCCLSESRDEPQEAPATSDCLAESCRDQVPPETAPDDDTQPLPRYATVPPTSPPPVAQEEQGPKAVPDPVSGSGPPLQQTQGHKQYCCEVCGKIFKHPSNLMLHKRMHTGEKPFQCNVCGKNFSQAGNLQTHLRRHSGEKPYICELCGKSFAAAGDVQRHIVVHTGQKPHLCDICGRGFSNFSNLKEHKKTHTADQTCTCDQCGKSFNMEKKLLKHKARHTGEKTHRCDTCGKCFMDTGDLRRHVRSHTGERPYLCNACGKSFTRCALLRRHSSTNCRGAPEAAGPEQSSSGGSDGAAASFPKPPVVGHGRPPPAAATGEQSSYPTVLPQKPPSSPPLAQPPKHRDAPPPPPGGVLLGSAASTSGSLPELRSLVPQHLLSSSVHQEKCPTNPGGAVSEPGLKPATTKPPHLPQEPVYGHYVENGGVMAVEMARPYLLPADSHSCVSLTATTSRAGGGGSSYKAGDGQFISSVTLWGLAMKTLQNENDMEQ